MSVHIPIVAISDGKLAFALGTLFTNLLLTAKDDTFYELNAILAPDFPASDVKRIQSLEKKFANRCKINIIKMDNRFDKIKNNTGYIANACAYKMCLAEVLPKYDKVIYLDTDVVVFEDLQEMYAIDLGNNYIGGVFSPGHYLTRRDLITKLEIPDLDQYVNAGVLMFNLKQIRKDKLEEKLCALIGSFDDSVDQHIFNKVCYNRIKLIPWKYNVNQTYLSLMNSDEIEVFCHKEYAQEVLAKPVIFHYTGPEKPWYFCNLRFSFIWYQYFRKSPFVDKVMIYRQSFPVPPHHWIMTYPAPEYQPRKFGWILELYYGLRAFLRPKARLQALRNFFCKSSS